MKLKVKFFAAARDMTGTEEITITVPDHSTSSDLLAILFTGYPRLAQLKDYLRIAVNWEYVSLAHPLADDDEVAVIPPVSGG